MGSIYLPVNNADNHIINGLGPKPQTQKAVTAKPANPVNQTPENRAIENPDVAAHRDYQLIEQAKEEIEAFYYDQAGLMQDPGEVFTSLRSRATSLRDISRIIQHMQMNGIALPKDVNGWLALFKENNITFGNDETAANAIAQRLVQSTNPLRQVNSEIRLIKSSFCENVLRARISRMLGVDPEDITFSMSEDGAEFKVDISGVIILQMEMPQDLDHINRHILHQFTGFISQHSAELRVVLENNEADIALRRQAAEALLSYTEYSTPMIDASRTMIEVSGPEDENAVAVTADAKQLIEQGSQNIAAMYKSDLIELDILKQVSNDYIDSAREFITQAVERGLMSPGEADALLGALEALETPASQSADEAETIESQLQGMGFTQEMILEFMQYYESLYDAIRENRDKLDQMEKQNAKIYNEKVQERIKLLKQMLQKAQQEKDDVLKFLRAKVENQETLTPAEYKDLLEKMRSAYKILTEIG